MSSFSSYFFRLTLEILAPIFFVLMLMSFIIGINRLMVTYNREKFSIIPFLVLTVNCFSWILYGIDTKEIAVYIANTFGLIIGIIGAIVYHHYSMYPPFITQYLITFVFLLIAMLLFTIHWINSLGTMAVVFSVLLYGSPLVTVFTVISEASTESMSLPLAITSFISAVLWTLYGSYVVHDIWVVIPSIMGLILVSIQFFLFFVYGVSPQESWGSTVHHMYSPITSLTQNAMHPPPVARTELTERHPMLAKATMNKQRYPDARPMDIESYQGPDIKPSDPGEPAPRLTLEKAGRK